MSDDQLVENHTALKAYNVIPHDHDIGSLPDYAKDAIKNLTPDEMSALKSIAERSNTHIYLHTPHDNRGIIISVV